MLEECLCGLGVVVSVLFIHSMMRHGPDRGCRRHYGAHETVWLDRKDYVEHVEISTTRTRNGIGEVQYLCIEIRSRHITNRSSCQAGARPAPFVQVCRARCPSFLAARQRTYFNCAGTLPYDQPAPLKGAWGARVGASPGVRLFASRTPASAICVPAVRSRLL